MSIHKWWQPQTRLSWKSFALKMWESIDTPRSLACYLLAKNGEWDQLIGLTTDPLHYALASDFLVDTQATKLLSKFPNLKLGSNRVEMAMRKFIDGEHSCKETNTRLLSGFFANLKSEDVAPILFRMQRKIGQILGPVPDLDDLTYRFGPGAAFGVRRNTAVYNKMHFAMECTFAMRPILEELSKTLPGWPAVADHSQFTFREGSALTFVPKNAKTDRSICIEPLLNGFVQKGIGTYMRKRLSRWGLTLNDQGVNQKLASLAHIRSLSTIDFENASDTISYAAILNLLPIDWVVLLDAVRSPAFNYVGNWYNFEKFSSMGNAYTFELETLVFYAAATATCEHLGIEYETGETLAVYGDDVIIPRQAVHLFSEVSSHLGFSINMEKSFIDGSFFESCGEDYLFGTPVRPFYLKKDITTLEDMYYVANKAFAFICQLETASLEAGSPRHHAVDRLHDLHAWCIGCIPRRYRVPGPKGSGDGNLNADFDVAVAPRHSCWDAYGYVTVQQIPVVMKLGLKAYVSMPFALYFSDMVTGSLEVFERKGKIVVSNIPKPLDNGAGYSVRGKSTYKVVHTYWHGPWPLLDNNVKWSPKAVALLKSGMPIHFNKRKVSYEDQKHR